MAATALADEAAAWGQEAVRKQRTMAFPRDCFGAHDRGSLRRGGCDEAFDGRRDLRRGHVVGVAPEPCVSPSGVDAVGYRLAEPAERLEMLVLDPSPAHFGGEDGLLGPRRSLRRGEVPNIREELDPVRGEEREELVERAGPVADGPDGHTIAVGQSGRHRIRLTEESNCIRSPEPDTASTPRAGRLR